MNKATMKEREILRRLRDQEIKRSRDLKRDENVRDITCEKRHL